MRLILLFWQLADRFGRVGSDGTHPWLSLSQEALGELVAARRSSVNVALRDLRDRGLVLNPSPGRWVLRGQPPADWDAGSKALQPAEQPT